MTNQWGLPVVDVMKLFPGGKFSGINCRRGEENIPHSARAGEGARGWPGVTGASPRLFGGLGIKFRIKSRIKSPIFSRVSVLGVARTVWGGLSASPKQLPCLSFPISKGG